MSAALRLVILFACWAIVATHGLAQAPLAQATLAQAPRVPGRSLPGFGLPGKSDVDKVDTRQGDADQQDAAPRGFANGRWTGEDDRRPSTPLHVAVQQQLVVGRIVGLGHSSGDAIEVTLKRRGRVPLALSVEPGTIFRCQGGRAQDMAGWAIRGERTDPVSHGVFGNEYRGFRATSLIVLDDDEEHTFVLEAYCLDFHKPNPSRMNTYVVEAPDRRVAELLTLGKQDSKPIRVIQSALWIQQDPDDETKIASKFPVNQLDVLEARALMESAAAAKSRTPKSAPRAGGVAGFGGDVRGFGEPASRSSTRTAEDNQEKPASRSAPTSPTSPTGPSTPRGPSTPTAREPAEREPPINRLDRGARTLLSLLDTNGNGKLERDEWSGSTGSLPAADRNSDGVITLDEIVRHLQERRAK